MGKRSRHAGKDRIIQAQKTPDTVSRSFDLAKVTFRTDFQTWVRDFEKKMRIKHQEEFIEGDASVDINSEHVEGTPDSMRLVTLTHVAPIIKEEVDADLPNSA